MFFKKKKEDEQKIIKRINAGFPSQQKLFYPLRDSEVSGLELLKAAGEFLYEGRIEKAKIELSTSSLQANNALCKEGQMNQSYFAS